MRQSIIYWRLQIEAFPRDIASRPLRAPHHRRHAAAQDQRGADRRSDRALFCDPQAPYQKPTVENTNRRVRRGLSRDTILLTIEQKELRPGTADERHAPQMLGQQHASRGLSRHASESGGTAIASALRDKDGAASSQRPPARYLRPLMERTGRGRLSAAWRHFYLVLQASIQLGDNTAIPATTCSLLKMSKRPLCKSLIGPG